MPSQAVRTPQTTPSEDRASLRLVLGLFLVPALTTLAAEVQANGLPHTPVILVGYGTLLYLAARVLGRVGQTAPTAAWVVVFFLALGVVVGLLRAQDPLSQAGDLLPSLILGLVWFFALATVTSYDRLITGLMWVGAVLLPTTWLALRQISPTFTGGAYNQYYGYLSLPSLVFLTEHAFHTRKPIPTTLAIAAWLTTFSMGARGPIVVGLLFLTLRVFLFSNLNPLRLFTLVLVAIVTFRYADIIQSTLYRMVDGFGLSTRILDRAQAHSLFEDDARSRLIQQTLKIIDSNPLFGVGIANDRPLIAKSLTYGAEDPIGWYPHNFFLEIYAQCGIVIGSFLAIALLARMLAVFRGRSDSGRARLVLLFFALGFLPLLFSGSYLSWPWFYGLLGILSQPLISHRARSIPTGSEVWPLADDSTTK